MILSKLNSHSPLAADMVQSTEGCSFLQTFEAKVCFRMKILQVMYGGGCQQLFLMRIKAIRKNKQSSARNTSESR